MQDRELRPALRCPVVEDFPLAVLRPSGLLDRAAAPVVRYALRKALTARPDLVLVDVSRLRAENDAILPVFAALARRCESDGVAFILCGPTPALTAALHRVVVCRLLTTAPSVSAALDGRSARKTPRRRHAFLPPLTPSVARARAIAGEACAAWDLADLLDPAQLVVGELVTNALRHARTEIGFSLQLGRYYLIVAVRDGSPVLPRLRTPDQDTGGRGLLIVEGLCASWDSAPTAAGKIVWATLRRPPRSSGRGPGGR